MKRLMGLVTAVGLVLGMGAPAAAAPLTPAARQYLADVAPYNDAYSALLATIGRDEKAAGAGRTLPWTALTALDAPFSRATIAGTRFDLRLVRQGWPAPDHADIRALAREQGVLDGYLGDFRYVTTAVGLRRWDSGYNPAASGWQVDTQIVRADLGLPAAR